MQWTKSEKIAYLLGTLRYLETKQTLITDPALMPLAREVGGEAVQGGVELAGLLRETRLVVQVPERLKQWIDFYRQDGETTNQPVNKALNYFDRIFGAINAKKFKGTQLADLLYAIWGVYTLNYSLDYGRVALVKEKKAGEVIMKKANLQQIIEAMVNYIADNNEPNIWFFNNALPKYLQNKPLKPKISW